MYIARLHEGLVGTFVSKGAVHTGGTIASMGTTQPRVTLKYSHYMHILLCFPVFKFTLKNIVSVNEQCYEKLHCMQECVFLPKQTHLSNNGIVTRQEALFLFGYKTLLEI